MPALQRIIADRYGGRDLPITVVLPDGARVPLSATPAVEVVARTWRGLQALAKPALGSLARAYVHGDIDFSGSARKVLGIAESMVGAVDHSREKLGQRFKTFLHQRRPNRSNIAHHYDVSNEFYRMWLDQRMVYSCAYFQDEAQSLDDAQVAKLDHICRKLRLAPGESFLDIGCGWGGLVFHAAENYGVHAHGITLSQNQYEHVSREIVARRLTGHVKVELRDYLDLPEDAVYDKVASVGMFEHVGLRNLPVYFGTAYRLLRDRGLFLNHGITSSDVDNREIGSDTGRFIDKYVFPHGELPHVALALREMSAAGFEVSDMESLRPHYARTLELWSDRLEARLDDAAKLVDEKTLRVWRVYLMGCAYGFQQGWMNIYQLLGSKQEAAGLTDIPLTREYMYR